MMKCVRVIIGVLALLFITMQLQATAVFKNDTINGKILYTSNHEYVPMYDIDLIEDQFSCMDTDLQLTFNERVYAFIQYFAIKDRDYTRMILDRKDTYFPIFEEALKRHGLPEDLKYLSIVESGLNPRAISRVGAVGLWQFMPYTGRHYGLHQDWYIDERMDPFEATDAACRYLKDLYKMFKDWELVLAAYNSGPGNVRKAIRRSGYKKSFWEVYRYLPRETRSYVPQYSAITYLLNHTSEHNFIEPSLVTLPRYDTLYATEFTDLRILADSLKICDDELRMLNPGIKHLAVPKNTQGVIIRIPSQVIADLDANRESYLAAASTTETHFAKLARNSIGSTYGRDKIVYRVRSGDVLGTIAQKFNVRISDLRKWNGIRGSMIRSGQRLNIWVNPSAFTSASTAKGKVTASKPVRIPSSKIHVVRPGDTLWDISRMYQGLTIEKIKSLNNLKNNSIKPGQKLLIG